MMALDKRTSMAHKFTRWVVLAGTVSVVALALFHGPVCAQQAAPAAAAEPGAAEPAKSTGQKPKSKSAGTEAKGAKKDPAVAQQQIEAGVASLQAGKADAAVQQFTAALSGGSLPSNLLARAHYQRGLAYRKQSKPALAISDLTHALWLKNGLNDAERADALQNRIAAYRDAGLPDQADAEGSGKSAGTKTATADAAVSSAGSGSTGSIPAAKPAAGLAPSPEAAPAPSGTGLGGFFGNLFGGSSNKSSAAQSTAAVPPKTEPAVSAWSSGTEVKVAAVPAPKAARSAAASPAQSSDAPLPWQQAETAKPAPAKPVAVEAATPATTASTGGRYLLQVGQLKSAQEAQTVAAKLKQQFVGELAGREASIVAVNAGGFGTLHRVSFGPFLDPAEWKTLCPKLLSAGHDCQPLKQ